MSQLSVAERLLSRVVALEVLGPQHPEVVAEMLNERRTKQMLDLAEAQGRIIP